MATIDDTDEKKNKSASPERSSRRETHWNEPANPLSEEAKPPSGPSTGASAPERSPIEQTPGTEAVRNPRGDRSERT